MVEIPEPKKETGNWMKDRKTVREAFNAAARSIGPTRCTSIPPQPHYRSPDRDIPKSKNGTLTSYLEANDAKHWLSTRYEPSLQEGVAGQT